ncbi:MAG TPA: hypothetical protein V6C46_05270 [Coleofasciculaceae cyanobacterium]
MEYPNSSRSMMRGLMTGGCLLLAAYLLLDTYGASFFGLWRRSAAGCQEVVQPQSTITRQQLVQLMTLPEGDTRQRVQAILKAPYCKLANIEIRKGAAAQREAYRLEFDDQVWLVVLYEGGQYAGYQVGMR